MKRYNIHVSPHVSPYKALIDKEEHPEGEWVKYEDIQKEIGEKCDCCGEYGRDRRNLLMGCGYDMNELRIPLKLIHDIECLPGKNRSLFQLFVCKKCRSQWMTAIKEWFEKHGREDE